MGNNDPNGDVQTKTTFNDALEALIHRARENGVEVSGGWECRTSGNGDYEAVIVELSSIEE